MKKVLFSFVILFSISAFAQDSTAINFANTINVEDLQKHLYILASDSLEGRETGQKGQKLAADYIARHFESIGIPPYNGETYYQEFPLLNQTLEISTLTINKELTFLEDYYTSPFYGSTSLEFESLQCIGFGVDEINCSDYRSIDVKDKVVLLFTVDLLSDKEKSKITTIETIDWEYQLEKAYQHGAKAVFFVDNKVKSKLKRYSAYFTKEKRNVFIESAKFKLPFAFIDVQDLESIIGISSKKLLKKVGRCKYPSYKVSGSFSTIVKEKLLQGENVLGYLEGTDLKKEILVITAHYDHLGIHDGVVHNGADDDGSGTVAILSNIMLQPM